MTLRITADHDDPNSVDDLVATGADVHLERMSDDHYWLGITVDGITHHFDLTTRKPNGNRRGAKIRGLIRERVLKAG